MLKSSILAIFTLLFTASFSLAQTSTKMYKIYDTRTGQVIEWAQLIQGLSDARIILWGEEHNDSVGHALQLEMLQALHRMQGRPLAFSMEMFQTDVQNVMDEYLQGWISEKNFKSEARAWNNYKDYAPMIAYAKTHKIPVVCANAPSRYTNMVTRGSLSALEVLPAKTKKAFLAPLPIDTLSGRYFEKFTEAMGGHVIPNSHIYQSQNLWDATMAHRIVQSAKKHRVFHIVGRFHTDEYQGTTARVLRATKHRVMTISCFAADAYDSAAHSGLADYVIITSAP